jgi:hypothetical protein
MRSITSADIEKWKLRRGASITARTLSELECDASSHRLLHIAMLTAKSGARTRSRS